MIFTTARHLQMDNKPARLSWPLLWQFMYFWGFIACADLPTKNPPKTSLKQGDKIFFDAGTTLEIYLLPQASHSCESLEKNPFSIPPDNPAIYVSKADKLNDSNINCLLEHINLHGNQLIFVRAIQLHGQKVIATACEAYTDQSRRKSGELHLALKLFKG